MLPKRIFPEALNAYITAVLYADLSRDSVRKLWMEGKELSGSASASSCEEILHKEGEKIFPAEERRLLAKYYDRENLLELYAQGERWIHLSYRRADISGSIRWVNHVIHLAEDPLTRDVYLFTYLIQADMTHQREQELKREIQRDPVTGLYNQATTWALIEQALKQNPCRTCGVAMLQLGGLEQMRREERWKTHKGSDCVFHAIALALGPQCIVGQYSADKLLLFWLESPSQEVVKHTLEMVFEFTRASLESTLDLGKMRFIAGAMVSSTEKLDVHAMADCCSQLCETWDRVVFPQEHLDNGNMVFAFSDEGEQVTLRRHPSEQPLSEVEKDAAFQCVSSMLSSDSMDDAVRGVLQILGKYYQADRVYVFTLVENHHVITMTHEWTGPQKRSIQNTMSGLLVDRFPILKRCIEERVPVFLSRNSPPLPRQVPIVWDVPSYSATVRPSLWPFAPT